jgi:hypothetical protein
MTAPTLAGSPRRAARPIDSPNEWPPGSGVFGPNDRQQLAHTLAAQADELLYGGARGGGKTDFALAEALRRCHLVEGFQAVLFRRTYKELSGPGGAIPRLLQRIPRTVGRWNGTERVWRFANGSALTLSYLETYADVQGWLGLEIQLMVFDQVEQLDYETYRLVRSSLRATGEIAAQMTAHGLRPASIATANPGGRGHTWVKRRFIDPFPLGGTLFRDAPTTRKPNPPIRCFVPAKLADNPALDEGDPSYRGVLEDLDDDDRAAQLEGDWDVYKGARFGAFRTRIHVRDPEQIELPPPGTAARAMGVDYGNDSPFVALWGVRLADDLIYVYREVSARGKSPAEQAQMILDAELPTERSEAAPLPVALDPACWAASPDKPIPRTGGQKVILTGPPVGSIAWHYIKAGLPVVRADNRRLEGAADVAGRLTVRKSDNLPRLLISSTCTGLIETLPGLQRDPKRPEDVIKGSTDHWYDALRYLLGKLGYSRTPVSGFVPQGTPLGLLDPDRLQVPAADAPARTLPSGITLPGAETTRGLRRRGF